MENIFKTYNNQNFHIFLDMDGVICDFNKRFIELEKNIDKITFDKHIDKHGLHESWSLISEKGIEWWSYMDWMIDGKELWEHVKTFSHTILSAPSREKESTQGKVIWANRELGLDIKEPTLSPKPHRWDEGSRMILNAQKYMFCKRYSNSILIDDTPKKIEEWIKNGGIGILHTDTKSTIEKLENVIKNVIK